jgi:hypothetical protein
MKKALNIINLLLALCWTTSAQAQKAYELIRYQGSIDGNKTTLLLADGYLPASKITIHSKSGDRVFSPSADGPDSLGQLRFEVVRPVKKYKNSAGPWLILKGLDKPTYPFQLEALYRDGKEKRTLVLKRPN